MSFKPWKISLESSDLIQTYIIYFGEINTNPIFLIINKQRVGFVVL